MNAASRRTARGAAFLGLALALSYLEFLAGVSGPVPGVKLGVANIAVLLALYADGLPLAAAVTTARVVLAGFLFSGPMSIVFGLAGAWLSLLVMVLLKKTSWFSVTGVSMAGGACHNLGQLLAARVVLDSAAVFGALPPLLLVGASAGALTGFLSWLILNRLKGESI